MNAVELSLFAHRLASICEEMGATLRQSAISPNIRDREDYSCALFDATGELVAQAAHIPVHLGSMAFCMRDVVSAFCWQAGDVVVFNDPFMGGTHLPDITVVMPILHHDTVLAFAAARAHHADIGGKTPGSMGLETKLTDEGLVISPVRWFVAGKVDCAFEQRFCRAVRNAGEGLGDLAAQRAACQIGVQRIGERMQQQSLSPAFAELLRVSEGYGRKAIEAIPDGLYTFEDIIEGDGLEDTPLLIRARITICDDAATVDFTGTAAQCRGPLNCPLSVTAAAVFYVFRSLMPPQTPQTAAVFRSITLVAPERSLVHAAPGAAVAAGNVETSQRIVDVVLGALAQALPDAVPAAAQGTMNNVIFGGGDWVYYETVGGGMGAHAKGDGLSAVQCHMTNTRNTSIEVLEMHYPLRIREYAIRRGSGGAGIHRGGDGIVREWEVLRPCSLSILSERRRKGPYGICGGKEGAPGINLLYRDGAWSPLKGKATVSLAAGERLRIETPGGGGYGESE